MGAADRIEPGYTWEDYRSWDDGQRWELIGGEAYLMSPSPASRHQAICGDLHLQLASHFKGRSCQVFFAPMDVKLSDRNVVQPDLLVVCDPLQIRKTHVEGPPELAVEILSPSSLRHDRIRKLRLYAAHGVPEYWLVQPYPPVVELLVLDRGGYRVAAALTDTDRLRSHVFPELEIDLAEVFIFPVPEEQWIDEIRETAPPYGASPGT